jgi:hypothetical protein
MAFESSVEWTEFEANEGGKFVPTDPQAILLTSDNHPYDEQFSQFSEIREDMLEIKQKFPQPTKDKFGDMLGKIKPRERGFAVRGIWYISSGGWFIEYTNNEVQSRFNLCKCRLGHLAPDSSEIYGHFTLRGQKQSTDKNKHPRKKDYRFRAPLDRAKALYKVLCQFCREGQMEMQNNASNVSITSSMSGDTTVVGSD